MHKVAFIIVISIALASHAAGAMLMQRIKIMADDSLCRLLPALWHGKGHDIPYHIAYSFGFSRYLYGTGLYQNAACTDIT